MSPALLARTRRPRPHVVLTHDERDLARIHDPGCNLAVWQRPRNATIERAAERLAVATACEWRSTACLGESDAAIQDLVPALVREREPEAAAALLADMALLVETFRRAHPDAHVEAALAMLLAPQCPRFHTDFVGIRLLHTWCGPGTEWIANEDVDRERLRDVDRGDAPPVLHKDFTTRHVAPFGVALLRGDASKGNAGNGIVHRSPDPRRKPRLLLTLDDGVRGDGPPPRRRPQQRRLK